jgi:hypothetical protein
VGLFEDTNLLAVHAKRVTIMPKGESFTLNFRHAARPTHPRREGLTPAATASTGLKRFPLCELAQNKEIVVQLKRGGLFAV